MFQGKDDLRQDAVMQQVFGMVNQLLKENAETRKRELRIRTYKVSSSRKYYPALTLFYPESIAQ